MATVTKPIALDESLNTTEQTPRNVADVLAQELARIAGRQASDVDYDNTDSGLTADNVQDAIDELKSDIPTVNDGTLTIQQNGETKGTFTANQSGNSTVNIETPTTDIQTAVDEFETYNGGLLSECKVALVPVQSGSGDPYPAGGGKNKFGGFVYSVTQDGITASFDGSGKVTLQGTASASTYIPDRTIAINNGYVFTLTAGTYTISTTNIPSQARIEVVKTDGTTIKIGDGSFTLTESTTIIVRLFITSGAVISNLITVNIQLEVGSTATDYAPYSNVRPISGHTQVDVDISNPNLIEEMQAGVWLATNGTYSVIAGYCCSKKFRIAPNKTYNVFATADATIGTDNAVLFYDENDNYLGQNTGGIIRSTTVPFTFTAPSNAYYCALDLKVSLSDLLTAEIVVDKEQITVNLGGTYYSGTLDVVSGEFVVTHGYKVFDGSETWNVADANRRVTSPVYDALVITDSSKKADMWCNSYPTTTNLDTYLGNLGISLENKRIFISDGSGNMDVNAFKVLLQNNPLQVAYPLATPLTIQLSPTMVKALVGENHLSAPLEGQEITESKYKQMFTFDDVIAYIQSLS